MDLLKKIDEIGKIVSSLRKENKHLIETNKQVIERETKAIQKLKDIMESIDILLGAQGKPLNNEKKGKNI
jgi:flagellar biosynthesis/type III secretory pathway chaperone